MFRALWELRDSVLCALVGKLALATREPLRKTPWLDDVLLESGGLRLSDDEEGKVVEMLGVSRHFTAVKTASASAVRPETGPRQNLPRNATCTAPSSALSSAASATSPS